MHNDAVATAEVVGAAVAVELDTMAAGLDTAAEVGSKFDVGAAEVGVEVRSLLVHARW